MASYLRRLQAPLNVLIYSRLARWRLLSCLLLLCLSAALALALVLSSQPALFTPEMALALGLEKARGGHIAEPTPAGSLAGEGLECRGSRQRVYLNPGQEVLLRMAATDHGRFMAGCQERYEVTLEMGDQDLSQWRIKVDVEEMNLPCSSSSLIITEERERLKKTKYCQRKNSSISSSRSYFSNQHMLLLTLKNKAVCGEANGCEGIGLQVRLTGEYVCGGRFRTAGGFIMSPFWPSSYPSSQACIYQIEAPKDKRISLTCQDFHLSNGCARGSCGRQSDDRTCLEDLETDLQYTSSSLAHQTLQSPGHLFTLHFVSNSLKLGDSTGYGFNCSYTFF